MGRVNENVRVELSDSAKRSVKDVKRARTLSGEARKAAEAVITRKRRNRRALDSATNSVKRKNQGAPGAGEGILG